MNVPETVQTALEKSSTESEAIARGLESYPTGVIDVLIFHRLHLHMTPSLALKSWELLREHFVDWNELRVSPIREIQEQLSRGSDSLELSVFIKDLLEFVHGERHNLDLEPLVEQNLTDIRRYLKQVRNVEPASIELVLFLRKSHPVLPLTDRMDRLVTDLGLVSADDSRDRRQKTLHQLVGPDAVLPLHHVTLAGTLGSEEPSAEALDAVEKFVGAITGKSVGRRKSSRKKAGTKSSSTPRRKTKSGSSGSRTAKKTKTRRR